MNQNAPGVQPSRRVAFDVIRAVTTDGAYANLLLPQRIADARLSTADAAFATELCYGTLRRQGTWDRIIELAANRPISAIDPVAVDALRMGVHQLIAMRVAAHAAVGEAVTLTRTTGAQRAAGFVNGVLRNITRTPSAEWLARAVDGIEGDERLSVEFSHPEWVIGAFRDALTADGRADDLESLLEADNTAAEVSLVALPGLAEPREFETRGSVSPIGGRSSGGDPASNPLVASGRVRVQDEGSQLAALALSRARTVQPGERWLDLCAGPGGKAALLAAEAAQHGASLLANELLPARVGLVRRAVAAVRPRPEVVQGDGRTLGSGQPGQFDRVLLDAPCTGLGALRRRPEARWRKSLDDIAGLVDLQGDLLDSAVAAVKPGGLIAYVTCSPVLAETRGTVDAALLRHPRLRRVDTPTVLRSIATHDLALHGSESAQLWPHLHGTDAMFIQLLTVPGDDVPGDEFGDE